jgi:hypothetical protein
MTSLRLPWHNVPFAALSLLQLLLLRIKPSVAAFAFSCSKHQHLGGVAVTSLSSPPPPALMIQSKVIRSTRLYEAGFSGDESSKKGDGKNNGQQQTSDVPSSSTRRRRKLVDRSNIYSVDTSSRTTTATTTTTTTTTAKSAIFVEDDEEELCFLDDLPGTDAGQSCFVSSTSPSIITNNDNNSDDDNNKNNNLSSLDLTLRYLPFIMPIVAYSSYESTARVFDRMVEFISNNNWIAVDGGQYQAEIITPAINGLVVPSLALLFATLVNNTINTLRQRQLQIRTSLNTEANDLRVLAIILDSLPIELNKVKNHLREYLIQYASRVIAESKPGLSIDHHMYIGSMDMELNGFLRMWNGLSMGSYGTMFIDTMLPASNYTVDQNKFDTYQHQLSITSDQRRNIAPFLSPYIFSETYDALTRLRKERSIRVSALQSTYPFLHYVILALLAASICTVFLMETNQDLLLFLSAIQLRVLWSMLIGTFTALGVVNYDLVDPFRGSCEYSMHVLFFFDTCCVMNMCPFVINLIHLLAIVGL